MSLRNRFSGVQVRVKGSKISVAGRTYDVPHVIVVGSNGFRLSVEPGLVELDAEFSDEPPVVETPEVGVLRIYRRGAEFQMDSEGSTLRFPPTSDTVVEGGVLTIKFESEEDGIIVKLPGDDAVHVSALRLESEVDSSCNIILSPFITGIVSFAGPLRARIERRSEATGSELRIRVSQLRM